MKQLNNSRAKELRCLAWFAMSQTHCRGRISYKIPFSSISSSPSIKRSESMADQKDNVVLTPKNVQDLRTLFNITHRLNNVLGPSWVLGREILQSTVDLVQNNLNLEVIYGDTDSIMIYSGLDDIPKAKAIAGKVIQEVNKMYMCLEIDLDGLYKRMLLLKKKKYATVKVQFKDGTPYEVIEHKGLDMVRRDWSLLSKELGDFCLSQILSGGCRRK